MPVPYLVLRVVRGVLQSTLPERSRSAWSEGSGRVSPHAGSGKGAWNNPGDFCSQHPALPRREKRLLILNPEKSWAFLHRDIALLSWALGGRRS